MSELQEERKYRLSQYGYSMNSFAYNVGIQPTNFGKMMSGTQKITDRTRRMIETRFPDLNFDWLLTGEGEMLREDAPRPMAQQNNHHSPGARMENNYYMRGGAEGGNIAAQNLEVKSASEDARPIIPSYMYNMPDYDIYANIKNGAANMEIFSVEGFMKQIDIIYRVQDNSMTPSFTSGDLIGIRRLPETTMSSTQSRMAYVSESSLRMLIHTPCGRQMPTVTDIPTSKWPKAKSSVSLPLYFFLDIALCKSLRHEITRPA